MLDMKRYAERTILFTDANRMFEELNREMVAKWLSYLEWKKKQIRYMCVLKSKESKVLDIVIIPSVPLILRESPCEPRVAAKLKSIVPRARWWVRKLHVTQVSTDNSSGKTPSAFKASPWTFSKGPKMTSRISITWLKAGWNQLATLTYQPMSIKYPPPLTQKKLSTTWTCSSWYLWV